jgi:putative endonuclease
MYFVYIIKSSKNHKLYKGFTQNLNERIKEHNSGRVISTKSGLPWKLIYYEVFSNKTDAIREELFLKSGKGKERIKFLLVNSIK